MTTSNPVETRGASLLELCNRLLGQRRLIMVSNRGPVDYHITADGGLQARRGSGGVVTALSSLARQVDLCWIASAMSEGDRRAAAEAEGGSITPPLPGQQVALRYVMIPRRVYHKFYNVFCNPLLWFLQHYMWNSPYTPNLDLSTHDAWENGYVPANQAFADEVVREARESLDSPVVMLHDYHFYLVPKLIRQQLPEALIQHFIHIPWPSPTYWQLLPHKMRRSIWEGLLGADILGFQAIRDVLSFLEGCQTILPDAQVDYRGSTVSYGGRVTQVRTYPVSIDVEDLRRIAASPRARSYEQRLLPLCGQKTVMRVDRVEPSKNIVRGFRAFSLLLERHPELRGQVTFLAFLVPSRTHIRQYQRYQEEIENQIQAINERFERSDWRPVTVFYENNYTQAVAGMRLYDALLVNPVIDGMNLVAKEGPVVNTRDGVLILSESAGAYEQLKEGALGVAPADLEGTMEALYQALTMSPEERQQRSAALVSAIEREDAIHWLTRQVEDLQALA